MFIYDDETKDSNLLKVKLREPRRFGTGSAQQRNGRTVVFQVTPELSESRSVNYKTVDPIHAPGQILAYTNTMSRSFNLTGIKLISRTREEATINLARLNLIRSWLMPVFGQSRQAVDITEAQQSNISDWDVRGAPPPVLEFSAYSDHNRQSNLYRIPVVIAQLGIQYPADVDYIPTEAVSGYEHIAPNTPFPTIMSLDMTITEAQSPKNLSNFSLKDYRLGRLEGF